MGWRDDEARKQTATAAMEEEIAFFAAKMTDALEELKICRTGPRGEFLREVLALATRAHARAGIGVTHSDD